MEEEAGEGREKAGVARRREEEEDKHKQLRAGKRKRSS